MVFMVDSRTKFVKYVPLHNKINKVYSRFLYVDIESDNISEMAVESERSVGLEHVDKLMENAARAYGDWGVFERGRATFGDYLAEMRR